MPRSRVHRTTVEPAVAPDGSIVTPLARLVGASTAIWELAPGRVSEPVRHRTVSEIWFVMSGSGSMWLGGAADDPAEEFDLSAGLSFTIPHGTPFQFRTGDEPLVVFGVTSPPWPEDGDADPAEGPWEPR